MIFGARKWIQTFWVEILVQSPTSCITLINESELNFLVMGDNNTYYLQNKEKTKYKEPAQDLKQSRW